MLTFSPTVSLTCTFFSTETPSWRQRVICISSVLFLSVLLFTSTTVFFFYIYCYFGKEDHIFRFFLAPMLLAVTDVGSNNLYGCFIYEVSKSGKIYQMDECAQQLALYLKTFIPQKDKRQSCSISFYVSWSVYIRTSCALWLKYLLHISNDERMCQFGAMQLGCFWSRRSIFLFNVMLQSVPTAKGIGAN